MISTWVDIKAQFPSFPKIKETDGSQLIRPLKKIVVDTHENSAITRILTQHELFPIKEFYEIFQLSKIIFFSTSG